MTRSARNPTAGKPCRQSNRAGCLIVSALVAWGCAPESNEDLFPQGMGSSGMGSSGEGTGAVAGAAASGGTGAGEGGASAGTGGTAAGGSAATAGTAAGGTATGGAGAGGMAGGAGAGGTAMGGAGAGGTAGAGTGGTAAAGTGGSGGTAGAGGSGGAGDPCTEANEAYERALIRAIQCDPLSGAAVQCQFIARGPCCPSTVNTADGAAELGELTDALLEACGSVACPEIACPAAPSYDCMLINPAFPGRCL